MSCSVVSAMCGALRSPTLPVALSQSTIVAHNTAPALFVRKSNHIRKGGHLDLL